MLCLFENNRKSRCWKVVALLRDGGELVRTVRSCSNDCVASFWVVSF